MKRSISSKIFIAFVAFFALFALLVFYLLKSLEADIIRNAGEVMSRGVLTSLENNLTDQPESHWNDIIKKDTDQLIYMAPIERLSLSTTQKDQLNAGEILFESGEAYQFFNLVIVDHTAYKKITNTDVVLVYNFSDPSQFIAHYINPVIQQIINDLSSKPEGSWNDEVVKLEKIYGFPIHVEKNSYRLPNAITHALNTKQFAFDTNEGTSQITTIYYTFDGNVLKIGPLSYLPIKIRISDALHYFIWAFFILAFCLIAFLSLMFVRNMKKIYQTTEAFSQAHFNFRTKINKTSVLYGLYTNINTMGQKLQQLMEAKKNMSRFVAHEIRTPLYTIQLALNTIEEIENLPAETHHYLTSIREDAEQLNHLLTSFLLYSQSTDQALQIKKEHLSLKNWLQTIVNHHQLSHITIVFECSETDDIKSYFDPKLLKHAVENLLINAVKFANHRVTISLIRDQQQVTLSIDDDGPGIADEDRKKAFDAFATLSQSDSFGGHIGLGLSIAKSIIQRHSGQIFIEQSPLGGCRFVIDLPNY